MHGHSECYYKLLGEIQPVDSFTLLFLKKKVNINFFTMFIPPTTSNNHMFLFRRALEKFLQPTTTVCTVISMNISPDSWTHWLLSNCQCWEDTSTLCLVGLEECPFWWIARSKKPIFRSILTLSLQFMHERTGVRIGNMSHLALADKTSSIPVAEQLTQLLHPHWGQLGVAEKDNTLHHQVWESNWIILTSISSQE